MILMNQFQVCEMHRNNRQFANNEHSSLERRKVCKSGISREILESERTHAKRDDDIAENESPEVPTRKRKYLTGSAG